MRLTKSQLNERQKELTMYNLMGVMNTSVLLYETAFALNPHYLNWYDNDKEEAKKWCSKAAQLFVDKLHFGEVEWSNGVLGSRWVDVELAGVYTRVAFYSKNLDKCDMIHNSKFMLVLDPHSKSH